MRAHHAVSVLLAVAGCSSALVTSHDPVLESRATELDARIETFIETMDRTAGTADGAYKTNWHFYTECRGETEALRRRAAADGHLEVARSFGDVAEGVESLRRAHEAGGTSGLDHVTSEQVRPVIRAAFEMIYRREAALRRGD
jgi:hypothetical protein